MTNVLLIDTRVKNYQIFVDSVNEHTHLILYSSDSTRDEIYSLIQTKFQKINRIAFVFEVKNMYTHPFLNNESLFMYNENIPYSLNVQFVIDLIKNYGVSNVDFMACNTLNYDNWKKYYDILQSETNVIVGASNNNSGNIQFGGDWIMESTTTDIELISIISSPTLMIPCCSALNLIRV
jgi:hypothetical protein